MSSINRISKSVAFDPRLIKPMNDFVERMKILNPNYSRSTLINQVLQIFLINQGGINKKIVEKLEAEKKVKNLELELKYAKELIQENKNG